MLPRVCAGEECVHGGYHFIPSMKCVVLVTLGWPTHVPMSYHAPYIMARSKQEGLFHTSRVFLLQQEDQQQNPIPISVMITATTAMPATEPDTVNIE